MNKLITRRLQASFLTLMIFSSLSFSQLLDLKPINTDFLRGGVNDGVSLLKEFITPVANAFGAGFSGGWYNTAKPHKLLGFDLTLTTNVGFVPSTAETFDLKSLTFSNISLVNPTGSGIAPTISGPNNVGPALQIKSGALTLGTFSSPAGINLKFVPVPMIQAGIGLPLGTEVKVRFFPNINYKDYQIGLWGVGVVHSIMQYVPGNDLLPFDLSLFGGYSKLKGVIPISVQPESSTSVEQKFVKYVNASSWDNQNITTTVSAWSVSLIGSVKLAVLTFYGGMGYGKTNTNIAFMGNYPTVRAPNPLATPIELKPVYDDAGVKTITPVDIENPPGLRASIGMRLKLAVITIHADYTKSLYNVVSAGLGISFR